MHNASRTYNTTTQHGPDETDPQTIDWSTRKARALVPFELETDEHGNVWPLNPLDPDRPAGRGELWHWGPGCAADAAVIGIDDHGARRLLMVERADGHGWALPGGMLDPGEGPRAAAARELEEETGLPLAPAKFAMLSARVVPDPRAGRHAWVETVPGIVWLDGPLPQVQGKDDARQAVWVPADSYEALAALVDVFPAHVDLVHEVLSADPSALAATA